MQEPTYCNNCGKPGHVFHQCKLPITSIGIIAFRKHEGQIQYLMIRRKDTLGFIDFMRGKYAVNNKYYIINMLKQMTQEEKNVLKQGDFDEVWFKLWGGNMISNQYKNEESTSREKYNSLVQGILVKDGIYTLRDLIEESDKDKLWTEAEWGFPKGRRNFQETDLNCAIREFEEETGFNRHKLTLIKNVLPFEEIFTGSNYKSYKHKYFLVYMKYDDSLDMDNFEKAEVSKMEWLSFTDCITHIRYYNTEKQILIQKVNECLTQCSIVQ